MIRHRAADASHRLPAAVRVTLVTLLAALLIGVLAPAVAGAAEPAVKVLANQAGSRDTLALYDLGNRTAAIYTFVSGGGKLGRQLSWRSAKGGFDAARAKFAAGDVNGDGRADGIALYDLGHGTSCLYVFIANGDGFAKKRAWKSSRGAFSWSRSRLAVGDSNADGRDDVIVLYDRGKGRASLYRFISKGTTFARSLGYTSARGGLYPSRAQLAAGDATGDGRADAIVLYSGAPARLLVFAAKGAAFVKKTFWHGAYPASAKLAVGDVDSDGDVDAVCLRNNGDTRVALDVFLSNKTAFAKPAAWWFSARGSLPFAAARVACGDVTGDGKTDAMIFTTSGTTTALAASCVSAGTAFDSGAWWTGAMLVGRTRLACAPGAPLLLSDDSAVLSDAAVDALQSVSPDGDTLTFDDGNPQVDGLAAGDVMVSEPSDLLPYGALKKVETVDTSGGHTVVTTVPASLDEVVKEGELIVNGSFSQNDVVRTLRSAPGVSLVPVRGAQTRGHGRAPRGSHRLGLTVEIDNMILDAININGNLSFNQSFSLSSDYGITGWGSVLGISYPKFGIKKVRFTSTSTQTTALRASVQKSYKAEVKQEIAKYQFPTFVVVVGVVPVTFTPELSIYVGASGEVTAGVTTRVTQVTTVTGGLEWASSGGWKIIKDSSASRTFDPPQPFGKMELKAFAGLEMMLKIYELAGPTAALEAYMKLAASTLDDPWWKLSCGIDAKAGVKVEALSKTLFDHSETFNIFDMPIDQAAGKYQPQGAVSGDILVTGTTTGVDGATVTLHQGAANPSGTLVKTTTSSDDGWYTFTMVPAGDYTVVASRTGFSTNDRTVSVTGGEATGGQDIEISSLAVPGVSGAVTDGNTTTALSGATVELRLGADNVTGTVMDSSTTPAGGTYLFTNLVPTTYTVAASKIGYFSARVTVTVGPAQATGQDLVLWPLSSQGLDGRVSSVVDGSNIAGATVTLHEGHLKPDGPVWGTTTSAGDGTYTFDGVLADEFVSPPGYDWGWTDYTVVATKAGFVRGIADADVNRGQRTTGVDLGLAPTDGSSPARAARVDDHILWPEASLWNDEDTYELWFKPSTTGTAYIAQTSFGYANFPGPSAGNAPVMWLLYDHMSRVQFGINEENGSGPGGGTQHVVIGMSFLQPGHWYHIAAECGPAGMKLFINGHLDASDPFTGRPEADWSDGTLNGGGFSLGDNDSWWSSYATARGQYKWVRVSSVQRYWSDFTPPATLSIDGATDVLDPLLGDTNGWNRGMVWTP